ncbi:MAG: ATP-binding protein [Actinomycetota bacterium]|nr:ATP-binding protein [Actinomycetota bacterium]
MSLKSVPMDEIGEAHLEGLVEEGARELGSIEYKLQLPGGSDADKREYLADVSSFANANGGDIVFGVDEDGGVPTRLPGLEAGTDLDGAILRLENVVRDGLSPRVQGVACRPVPVGEGRHAIVLRVPRSFARPHMVTFKGSSRFFARSSAGKHPMDVGEIRGAVLASEAVAERVRAFRSDRLGRIASGEAPVALKGRTRAVLHLVPLAAFDVPAPAVDLEAALRNRDMVAPGGGGSPRYNFDGLVTEAREAFGDTLAYAQLFRSGAVEAVDADPFDAEDGELVIRTTILEKHLLEAAEQGFRLMRSLGVAPPALAMLSLVGVKGFVIPVRRTRHHYRPVDREDLVVPEGMVEGDWPDRASVERLMRPMFDAVWNACGFRGSENFGEDGRWIR